MADGSIKITVDVDGKQVDVASKSLDNLEGAGRNAGDGVKDAEQGLKGVGNESGKASGLVKKFVTSLGLVAIAASAFKVLKASMDDAISRFDTLNKFPKVLQALGVSAEDSERAMNRLSDGIDGLPTKLDDIASNAQRMYTSFKDMDKATDSALALNNALLASGSSGAEAASGTEQYIQALQKGKPDMMEWRNMQQNMSIALDRVAEQYGITTDELGAALRSGEISMDSFNDKMIELGTGTGELAELAKTNSLGLATSLENLKTAAARGIADIIESFNRLSQEATGKELAQHIDSLKVVINSAFKVISRSIKAAVPIVKLFINVIKATKPVVSALTPAIAGLAAAYAAFTVINKVTAAIKTSNAILKAAQASTKGLTISTSAQTIADVKAAATKEVLNAAKLKGETLTKAEVASKAQDLIATQAQTVATAAQTGAVKLSTLAIGVMTGQIGILTAAKVIATAATYALKAALDALTGPIGWIIAIIGLLVAGGIAFYKWLKKETEASKKLTNETEKLAEATEGLVDTVTGSSKAYKDSRKETAAQSKANKSLAKEITKLAEKENKSAAEKMILKDKIEQLNGSVSGLNLSYNEEANALSMSNEQLQSKIDLTAEQASYDRAMQRRVEIEKEQHEVAMQLKETNALREEWNQKLADGSVKSGKHKEAVAELDEQEALLRETNASLAAQHAKTEAQITESAEKIATATGESADSMIIDFENLEGAQKEAFDNMSATYEELVDAATDAFDKLDTETEHTMTSMTETLEHNQKVVAEWGENQAKLMKWAGENGYDNLMPYIENMGIDSAAELAVMANATDEEMTAFAEALGAGAETGGESFKTSLGNEFDGVIDQMIDHTDQMSTTLRQKMEEAGFNLGEGLSGGIEEGTPEAEASATDMADKTTQATEQAFGVQSPSTVFKAIGGNLTDGLALGITQGSAKVEKAIQQMFKSVEANSKSSFSNIAQSYDSVVSRIAKSLARLPEVTQSAMKNMLEKLKSEGSLQISYMRKLSKDLRAPFKNLNNNFKSIGLNAMNGLNSGLISGRARVMATAKSIADNVARTMKNALKIESPSKVMRDEVGRWIPEGLAAGIKENAKSVYKELDSLSNNMLAVTSPEVALGTRRMAYAGGISNHSSSSTTNHNQKSYSPTINNYFTRDESTPSEVSRKNKQQQQRLAMEWGY